MSAALTPGRNVTWADYLDRHGRRVTALLILALLTSLATMAMQAWMLYTEDRRTAGWVQVHGRQEELADLRFQSLSQRVARAVPSKWGEPWEPTGRDVSAESRAASRHLTEVVK
jgi:hypothetical protein